MPRARGGDPRARPRDEERHGELCEQWFEQVYPHLVEPGPVDASESGRGRYPEVGLRGGWRTRAPVRGCSAVLPLRSSDERGVRVAHVPGGARPPRAQRHHPQPPRAHDDHARGECEARTDHDALRSASGTSGPSPCGAIASLPSGYRASRPSARWPRPAHGPRCGVGASCRGWHESWGLGCRRRWRGARWHTLRRRLSFTARQSVAGHLPIARRWRWPSFLEAHRDAVRLARLEWVRDRVRAPGPPMRVDGRWSVGAARRRPGRHPRLERHDGPLVSLD